VRTILNRNQPIPLIEIFLSFGILFLIILVGWRLYNEVSGPVVPLAVSQSQPTPSRLLRLPVQSTMPPVTTKRDIQISAKEYKRVIDLERQVVTLSVNQASHKKQLERFLNLERDVATIVASKDGRKENADRLASLERGVANLAASQAVQQENSDRLADLERGVATLSAVQTEQKGNTTRLSDLERGVATLSAKQEIHNQRSSRLLGLEKEVATLTANSKIQNKYPRQFNSIATDSNVDNTPVNRYREPVRQARVVRQAPRAVHSGIIYDHDRASASDQNIVKRGFFIPAGCFIYNEYAKKLEQRIASWGLPVYRKKIISKEHYFNCLFVGPTMSRATAENNLQILQDGSVSKAVAVKAYR
jgi:cell division septation protein DedD